MGATGFVYEGADTYLIGSFSGLLRWHRKKDVFTDFFSGKEVSGPAIRKRGPYQANGIAKLRNDTVIIDYRKGLYDLYTGKKYIPMPEKYRKYSTITLSHFLFEIHNGRILRSIFPKMYILHNPIVAIISILVIISGFIILIKRKLIFKPRQYKKQSGV